MKYEGVEVELHEFLTSANQTPTVVKSQKTTWSVWTREPSYLLATGYYGVSIQKIRAAVKLSNLAL